ncbi:MAG: zinc ribbon domain-containing protein [Erysipelotrichaceae bacterium]|nr:zinc ribbon domain-containing protein [Erysipelotrichaceae bacterium]
MLNCKNCGAPLSLEDAVCPYCGTPNEEAKVHIDTLDEMKEDFKETKTEVIREVKKTKKGYNLLVMIVLLLLANLVLVPFHTADYEIAEHINASKLDREEVIRQMNEALNDGEYARFVALFDRYAADYNDFRDYTSIYYQASEYMDVMETVSNFYYEKDPYSDPLVKACSYIKDYEDAYASYLRYHGDESGFALDHINRINDEADLFLRTYLKLTDEDIGTIKDISASDLLLLVSRRLGNEE